MIPHIFPSDALEPHFDQCALREMILVALIKGVSADPGIIYQLFVFLVEPLLADQWVLTLKVTAAVPLLCLDLNRLNDITVVISILKVDLRGEGRLNYLWKHPRSWLGDSQLVIFVELCQIFNLECLTVLE